MYKLSKTNKKLLIFSLFLFIIFSSLSLIKTDYYFMSPGPPYQWEIEYGDAENFDFEGSLYQLTVRRDEANALAILKQEEMDTADHSIFNNHDSYYIINRNDDGTNLY